MKTQLANDLSRCYGYTCNLKRQCQRYLTISLDDPDIIYSYHIHPHIHTPPLTKELTQCNFYIEYKN